jgi:hypothetical protein
LIRFENGVLGIVENYFVGLFSALSFDFPSHVRSPMEASRSLLACCTRHYGRAFSQASTSWHGNNPPHLTTLLIRPQSGRSRTCKIEQHKNCLFVLFVFFSHDPHCCITSPTCGISEMNLRGGVGATKPSDFCPPPPPDFARKAQSSTRCNRRLTIKQTTNKHRCAS